MNQTYLPLSIGANLAARFVGTGTFAMRVLGTEEFTVACSMQQVLGRRLIVRLSAPVPENACIKIACDGKCFFGEVLGSWRQGSSIFGAIELRQTLDGLVELRFFGSVCGNGSDVQEAAARLTA